MEALTLAALAALASKFVDLLKYLRAKDYNGVITQLVVWAAGIVVLFLASGAAVAEHLKIFGNVELGALDWKSKVLAGASLLSTLSVVYDYKKARDGTDSASTPPLTALPPPASVATSPLAAPAPPVGAGGSGG